MKRLDLGFIATLIISSLVIGFCGGNIIAEKLVKKQNKSNCEVIRAVTNYNEYNLKEIDEIVTVLHVKCDNRVYTKTIKGKWEVEDFPKGTENIKGIK